MRERRRSLWVIALLLSLISVGAVSSSSRPTPEPTSSHTIIPRTVTTDNTEYAYKQLSMAQRTNCTLKPTNVRLYHDIKKSLEDGMTMLEYEFKLEDGVELDVMHDNTVTALFLPLFWFRYVGRFSSRLLLLKPNYDVMSFQILDIGVRKFTNITLREEPKGCLSWIGLKEYEIIIRELVMTDFTIAGNDTTVEAHDGSVCNMHVTDDEGWAEFKYYCCKYDDYTNVTCSYLENDFYLDLMRTIIRVFKVLFILLCPALLPPRFYGHNRKMKQYKYKLSRPFRIFVQLKSENMGAINENALLVDDDALHKMEEFKKKITKEPSEVMKKGKVYEIDEAELKVQRYKLIESGHAPANIFDTIYRSLVLCKIRDLPSLKDCCSANLFPSSFGCVYTWRRFCRVLGNFIYTLVILAPWIARLAIYYVFEREEIETRKKSAEDNDLMFKFPGNLTMLLTPIHVMFVIIYVVIAIEGVIFKKLNQKIVHDLQYVFKHCFRDMMKEKKTKAVCNIVKMLLLPFRQLGIFVFIIGPFLWLLYIPLAICAFLFYMFPTINITIRLLYNLVALPCGPETSSDDRARQNNNTNTFTTIIQSLQPENLCNIEVHGDINRNRHNQRSTCQYIVRMIVKCAVILITMVTVYSCIILLTEFAVFFVDVVVYTLIGCILYANHTMTYISLLVLTSLYAKDAYGTVSQKYRDFSAVLNKYIFNLRGEQLKCLFYESEKDQQSTAFRINPCDTIKDSPECKCEDVSQPTVKLVRNDKEHMAPLWRLPNLLLFLRKDDIPLIPKNFLFYACEEMDYFNKPGRRLHGYLQATWNFIVIVIFLLFVVLVVMTFGESTQLSATNKLLATIAGGIVPFLLRTLVFRRFKVDGIKPEEDLKFRVAFHDLLMSVDKESSDDATVDRVGAFTDWPVYDFKLRDPAEDVNRVDADVEIVVEMKDNLKESMLDFESSSESMA